MLLIYIYIYIHIYIFLHVLKTKLKKEISLIFSYRLLHSFLLPPGPQERKTDNFLPVKKTWSARDFQIEGGSIKTEGEIFRGC